MRRFRKSRRRSRSFLPPLRSEKRSKRSGRRGPFDLRRGLRRDEGGFGWISIIFFIIMLAVATAVAAAMPWIVKTIATGMKAEQLTVHVPLMVGTDPGMELNDPVAADAGFLGLSQAMGSLYGQFRLIAMVSFIIVFIFIGISYLLEQFRLIGEGTSQRMISESILFAILLFAFPYAYNLSAHMINSLNEQVILTSTRGGVTTYPVEMVEGVCSQVGDFPDINIGAFGKVITMFVFGTMSLAAVFTLVVSGALRLLGTVAFAAAFPLVLIFFLIPFTRRVGNTCVSTLMGFMLSTIFIAIFFRVVWQANLPGGSMIRWVIGVGTLTSAAMFPTVFAPAIGRTFLSSSLQAGAAAAGTMGGALGAYGGFMGGAAGGALGAGRGVTGFPGAQARTVGMGALKAGIAGMRTRSPVTALMMGPGVGREEAHRLARERHGIPMSAESIFNKGIKPGRYTPVGLSTKRGDAFAHRIHNSLFIKPGATGRARKVQDQWRDLTHKQRQIWAYGVLKQKDGQEPSPEMVEDVIADGSAENSYREFVHKMQTHEYSNKEANYFLTNSMWGVKGWLQKHGKE